MQRTLEMGSERSNSLSMQLSYDPELVPGARNAIEVCLQVSLSKPFISWLTAKP